MDGRFYSRKRGGWGIKKMGDVRDVIHTTVFGSDRAKYPHVLYKKCIMSALYRGTTVTTVLGHDTAG